MNVINRRKLVVSAATVMAMSTMLQVSWAQDSSAPGKGVVQTPSPLGDRFIGRADAPVVMIEYASATCPHCAEFHEKLLPLIKAEYIDTGKVKFIFREFPLDQPAFATFVLARCLPEDKYFPALGELFSKQSVWTKGDTQAEVLKIMNGFGMTKEQFDVCLKREDIAKPMYDYMRQSAKDFGIKGTPALFVNETMIDGHKEMSDVKETIDAAIAAAIKK